ncbi:periplasmic heavy metal sensor [Chachezhania sediminis]|uniref:periplasmic heavy metal sensor n=1 Tax=Chachezhania sediminis TaxID=2599291 RepID=UPI00131B10BC|nr:periplasmic heavy metal sensor [Chachezhania sediminis]
MTEDDQGLPAPDRQDPNAEAAGKPSPDPSARRARAPRWIRVALAVSLALNLAVLGSVLGIMLRFGGSPGADGIGGPPSLGMVLYRELPREEQRALRDEIRREMQEDGIGRPPSRRDTARTLDAGLRADPFDRQLLEGVLTRHNVWVAGQQHALQEVWLDRVTEMTPAERDAYADRLQAAAERHEQRRKAWHDKKHERGAGD